METLCREIGLPEEAIEQVLALHGDPEFHPDCQKLTRQDCWEEGLEELHRSGD